MLPLVLMKAEPQFRVLRDWVPLRHSPPSHSPRSLGSGGLFLCTLAKTLAGYISLERGCFKKCLQNRTLWLIVNSCERRIIPVGVTLHSVFINKRRGCFSMSLSNLYFLSHQTDLIELSILFFFQFFHPMKVYFLRYLRIIMSEAGRNGFEIHSLGSKHGAVSVS